MFGGPFLWDFNVLTIKGDLICSVIIIGDARDTIPEGMLDGSVSWHYRCVPLLYAVAPDEVVETVQKVLAPNKIKKVVKAY